MSNDVYANGNAIACKAGDDKVIAAMPDVCLSPPSPPAGPVPVPYPNTSFSKDMQNGSKSVHINDKEVMLKDRSFYKTSPLGDEAATRSFGGSVITHTITGKTYFSAWSMDVKFEDENVPRHLDLTTSNHNPYPGSTAPTPAQELAMQRMADNQCPCCGSADCPAAFVPGDVGLTQEEYYTRGMTPARCADWRASYRAMKKLKKSGCTCSPPSKSFPEAPCDVFRAPNEDRYNAIERAWDPPTYRAWYQRTMGVVLNEAGHYLGIMLEATGNAAALRTAANVPRNQPSALRDEYRRISREADGVARTNHLTPKVAGGCPTSPDNLQPQQVMCDLCQMIDDDITTNPLWQG